MPSVAIIGVTSFLRDFPKLDSTKKLMSYIVLTISSLFIVVIFAGAVFNFAIPFRKIFVDIGYLISATGMVIIVCFRILESKNNKVKK